MLGLFLSIFAIVFSATNASSEVTDVKVQIINSKPLTYSVKAYPVVISNTSSVAWCQALVKDLNSFEDIALVRSQVGLNVQSGSVNRISHTLISKNKLSVTEGQALAGFVIPENAAAGTWTCTFEVQDNADDTASNSSKFKVAPKTCSDDALSEGEEAVDCGGPCLDCSCFNGVKDEEEDGVDCGIGCVPCQDMGTLRISVPHDVKEGDTVEVRVRAKETFKKVLVRVKTPSGELVSYSTDEDGKLSFTAKEHGEYTITADLLGYESAEKVVKVAQPLNVVLLFLVAVLAIAAIAVITYIKKK